jgi:hypothetical protein
VSRNLSSGGSLGRKLSATSSNHQLAPLPLVPNYFTKKKYSDTLLPRMNAAKIAKFKMVVKVPSEGI